MSVHRPGATEGSLTALCASVTSTYGVDGVIVDGLYSPVSPTMLLPAGSNIFINLKSKANDNDTEFRQQKC